jgi:hypothetical protein
MTLPCVAPSGTAKVPVIEPGVATEQVLPNIGVKLEPQKIAHAPSISLKLLPVTATDAPAGPKFGDSNMDGVTTLKALETESCPTRLGSFIIIVYEGGLYVASFLTAYVPVRRNVAEIEHVSFPGRPVVAVVLNGNDGLPEMDPEQSTEAAM